MRIADHMSYAHMLSAYQVSACAINILVGAIKIDYFYIFNVIFTGESESE